MLDLPASTHSAVLRKLESFAEADRLQKLFGSLALRSVVANHIAK